jgi:sec-independent protein translocase protein TatA
MSSPLIAGLGPQELILILLVLVLLFGATKLPELARGSGRALRIFKAETKGLMDDDDDKPAASSKPAELPKSEPVDAEIVEDAPKTRTTGDNA